MNQPTALPCLKATALSFLLLFFCGCDDKPTKEPPPPGTNPALSAAAHLAPAPSGPAPSASASASAEATAESAGTWRGSYDAKKGDITLPKGVKNEPWSKDEGKVAVGQGTVTLTIRPDGALEGKSEGALGPAVLTGTSEGAMVRATFMPEDPHAKGAMTGVLVGIAKDGAIRGEINVSGGDGNVIRHAKVELKRE